MRTMCTGSKTLCLTLKGCEWAICFSTERDWSQECYHGNNIEVVILSFMIYIFGAKFEEHCSNISGDILDSVFNVIV